jgi:hypothetical protein
MTQKISKAIALKGIHTAYLNATVLNPLTPLEVGTGQVDKPLFSLCIGPVLRRRIVLFLIGNTILTGA